MKKNKNGENVITDTKVIENGYIDLFYCYKLLKVTQYNKLFNRVNNLQSTIVKFGFDDNNKLNFFTNDNYYKFLDNANTKKVSSLKQEINNYLKEISIDDINVSINLLKHDNGNNSPIHNNKINIEINSDEENFIVESTQYTLDMISENSIYLNKDTNLFSRVFLLQPIKTIINGLVCFINVKATIYKTGNLILQYSVPISNVNFFDLYYTNGKLKYQIYLPEFVKNKGESYYHIKPDDLYDGIYLYNKYILNQIDMKFSNECFFTNYTIIDYSDKPDNFNGNLKTLGRELYWLANYPYGYINEQDSINYADFINKRYDISSFSSLFNSTNCRTIIAFNKSSPKSADIKEWFDENKNKYFISITYISLSIEILMIKKSYYQEISWFKITNSTTLKQLIERYNKILDINNTLFHISLDGYGSINRLIEYLESNLIDFLPIKNIDKLIENYKDIISLKESEINENKNYTLSLLAVIFTIIFGLEPIDNLTKTFNKLFKSYNLFENINISDYSIHIWIFIILFSIVIIYKHQLFLQIKRLKRLIIICINKLIILFFKIYKKNVK